MIVIILKVLSNTHCVQFAASRIFICFYFIAFIYNSALSFLQLSLSPSYWVTLILTIVILLLTIESNFGLTKCCALFNPTGFTTAP